VASIGVLGQRLLDLLFPPRCVSCGAGGAVLCAACVAELRSPAPPLCAHCGRSLASFSADHRSTANRCPLCAPGTTPSALTAIRVALRYEGGARKAIHALKYNGQRRLAEPLGDLLAEAYRREPWPVELIVPMPLHATRERQRGYNQAMLLARSCGTRLGVPVRGELLRRVRATESQTHLSRAERQSNVAGAFALAGRAATAEVAGKHILLLDDVTTTGSTLEAAARALASASPAAIWALALARPELARETPPSPETPSDGSARRGGLFA
jgi:ComF family protein